MGNPDGEQNHYQSNSGRPAVDEGLKETNVFYFSCEPRGQGSLGKPEAMALADQHSGRCSMILGKH